MTPADHYAELIRRTKEASLLGSCASVLGWDERVNMLPRERLGVARGEQMAAVGPHGPPEMAIAPERG